MYLANLWLIPGTGFSPFEDMEEPFWTFTYIGRSSINDEVFVMEADLGYGLIEDTPDVRRGFVYSSIFISPFYSLSLLESVRRLYRVNHWF